MKYLTFFVSLIAALIVLVSPAHLYATDVLGVTNNLEAAMVEGPTGQEASIAHSKNPLSQAVSIFEPENEKNDGPKKVERRIKQATISGQKSAVESTSGSIDNDNSHGVKNPEVGLQAALRDLEAQVGMWKAADKLVVLTRYQLIAGIFGAVLIGFTLYQTRLAAKDARATLDTVKMETRAFIAPEVSKVAVFKGDDRVPEDALCAYFILHNYGKTPATGVKRISMLIPADVIQSGKPIKIEHQPQGHYFKLDSVDIGYVPPRIGNRYNSEGFAVGADVGQTFKGCGYWCRYSYFDIYGASRCEEVFVIFDEVIDGQGPKINQYVRGDIERLTYSNEVGPRRSS